MPAPIITAVAQALHQLGAVILVGGLVFLLFVLRPVSKEALGFEKRQQLFQHVYKYMLRWQWLALLLLWVGGVSQIAGLERPPGSFSILSMAAGGALITLLTLGAQVACYFHLSERMEDERWGQAAAISSRVRLIMAINLLLCLALVFVGSAAPLLDPLFSLG
jgi:uncharacterized membrane protein